MICSSFLQCSVLVLPQQVRFRPIEPSVLVFSSLTPMQTVLLSICLLVDSAASLPIPRQHIYCIHVIYLYILHIITTIMTTSTTWNPRWSEVAGLNHLTMCWQVGFPVQLAARVGKNAVSGESVRGNLHRCHHPGRYFSGAPSPRIEAL
jgi:hypothetical protein